jgi:hypothetical protein
MKDFCIVGSGVAGSTIAKLLYKKYSVEELLIESIKIKLVLIMDFNLLHQNNLRLKNF